MAGGTFTLRDKLVLVAVILFIVGSALWYRKQSDQVSIPTVSTNTSGKTAGLLAPADSVDELTHYEAMFRAHPDHSPIVMQLALLHSGRGNRAEAIKYYHLFLQIDTSATAWEARLDLAKEYFNAGMRDSARFELMALEKEHPEHPGVLYNVGAMAANDGDFAKAKEVWQRLVKLAPDSEEGKMAAAGLGKLKS